jgi:hypothetical protein
MEIFNEENAIIVKALIKRYPNDGDLGREIRKLFRSDKFVLKLPNDRELGTEVRKIYHKSEKN